MQSRVLSLVETLTSTFVGFTLSAALLALLCWLDGVQLTWGKQLSWTLWFTLLSIARGYVIRRVFNGIRSSAKV